MSRGQVISNRSFKYRVFPNDEQAAQITKTFGCTRKVYNLGLELQYGLFESGMCRMSQIELNNLCNRVWKKETFPFLSEVDKFALTNSLIHLEMAYKRFFDRKAGGPKFKSKKTNKQSYTTNWTNNNIEMNLPKPNSKRGRIKLPKLGWVDACIHRQPGKGWTIKQATVSKSVTGKYYVSVLFAIPVELPEQAPVNTVLGLDYSSPHFYVDSNGEYVDTPHWYRRTEDRLGKEQRKLARMIKGSNNYEKQRLVVAKIHERTSNQRRDFTHKLSREIANSYDAVCVEDLDLRSLSQALRLGKATMDNGFGMFRTFLRYKLEEQGKHFIKIDRWYPSSKTCNHCGGYNPKVTLGVSEWVCPHCGAIIQRDYNAARNIRGEGLRELRKRAQTA